MSRSMNSYNWHKGSAAKRNIPFNLTYQEWFSWWLFNGVNKDKQPSPFNKDTLCMCRYNDSGPYEISNIYCATNSDNVKLRNYLLNNNSAPNEISTPFGVFKSARAASKCAGVHPNTIKHRIKTRPNEYYYNKK